MPNRVTASENKLKDLILARNIPMGSTETGRVWCLKALHPADSTIPFSGIPDPDSMPVVMQNYQQTVTCLNPTPSASGNWDLDVFFFPHPYLMGAVHTIDSAGVHQWTPILNNQISGASVSEKRASFTNTVERYRLGYLGITGYHDASALSNNGQLSAAQFTMSPSYTAIISPAMTGNTEYVTRLVELWNDAPRTFEQLQSSPNAYFGAARDGVYVPFRLTETSQDWQSGSDTVLTANYEWSKLMNGYAYHAIPNGVLARGFPYGLTAPMNNPASWGDLVHRRSDCGVVQISMRQLAQAASFTFYVRAGWEYQVQPGTQYVSFAKTSPQYDQEALTAYFLVSRELKDAYPASYNDLGSILSTIGSIAASILPAVFRPLRVPRAIPLPKAPAPSQKDEALSVARPIPNLEGAASRERRSMKLALPAQQQRSKQTKRAQPKQQKKR